MCCRFNKVGVLFVIFCHPVESTCSVKGTFSICLFHMVTILSCGFQSEDIINSIHHEPNHYVIFSGWLCSRLHFLLIFDPIYYQKKFFFRFLERISFMVKDLLWLYFEWKLNISALRWRFSGFWRVESLRNSRRRRLSVQVNKHFMANIYAVYCAVKLVLLRKG